MDVAHTSPATPRAGRFALSPASVAQDVALVTISLFFFWAHARNFFGEGDVPSALLAVDQGLLVGIFLVRRRTSSVSRRPRDWFAAAAGWVPLLARPYGDASGAWEAYWVTVQMLGVVAHIWALGTLGRSFGVVAANRGVKVGGPYRFVRHPIYASSFISQLGYTVLNPSPWNIGLVAVTAAGQIMRMNAEERFLGQDPAYRDYATQVRWRILPGVY
jgi:protein-S-isoprenylcysteine O-methyltransferase Ste14